MGVQAQYLQLCTIIMMKAVLLVAVVGLAAAKPQPKELTLTEGRIIGGEEAPKHEFPWQVSLKSFGSHICGGSIVNKNQILTAAHCCQGQLAALDSIVAGAHDRNFENGHQNRGIHTMEFHENWNTPDFDHDICIVTLKEELDFSDPNVQPIEFFQLTDEEIPAETVCNSTGWGLTNGGGLFLPNHLQWIQIPVHSAADCESIFEGYITENMICAGSAGHATCNGDSGGPLVCPAENGVGKLAGIVSFGYTGCTDAGVYAKVSQFTDWIAERWQD